MSQLSILQKQWLQSLYSENETSNDFLKQFKQRNLAPADGIAVYRESLRASLLNHLQDAYQYCQAIVGEEFWCAVCRHYIDVTPSTHADIADYGANLNEFIAEFPHTHSFIYLPDIAKLDWAWHRCFYSEDAPLFDAQGFASLSETECCQAELILNPSLAIIHSAYPIFSIVESIENHNEKSISIDNNPQTAIVWRQGFTSRIELASEAHQLWFELLSKALSWQDCVEQMSERFSETDCQNCLTESIQKQWISEFRVIGRALC